MKIELAGYNIDSSLIEGAKHALGDKDIWTPETISAAYARISRSDKTVSELRQESINDIEKARKSNNTIIYDYRHDSIAEHAVFNFDICDISRLATEHIQRHRLISFTERSQRYTLAGNNYVLPFEINQSPFKFKVINLIEKQFDVYNLLYRELIKEGCSDVEAKEDARYALPLCATAQMGMTINARNLEMLIKRLYSYNINELSSIADYLFNLAHKITPSLIKYINPNLLQKPKKSDIYDKLINCYVIEQTFWPKVELINQTLYTSAGIKEKLVSAILFELDCGSYVDCYRKTILMDKLTKDLILLQNKNLCRGQELIDLTFELEISASCYAQLKRHRMTTQIPSSYSLNYVTPESIKGQNLEWFQKIQTETRNLYIELIKDFPKEICQYILTNANTRKVLFKTNLREFNHILKLRTSKKAQWEIKEIVNKVNKLLKGETNGDTTCSY